MNHKRYIKHVWRRTRIDQIALNRTDAETLESHVYVTTGKPYAVGSKKFFEVINKLALRLMKKTGWLRQNITGKDLADYAYSLHVGHKRYFVKTA